MSSFVLKPPTWASDLVEEPETNLEWVAPRTLARRDRVIFTGAEGEGKSTLLRQMAVQLASGITPFYLTPNPPQRVFYMDLENSREQIKAELTKICDRAELSMPGEPYLAIANWPSGLNLINANWEAELRKVLLEYKPDVVIGGPMYKMLDVSLSDETASLLLSNSLDRLKEEVGHAYVLEAHQVNEAQAFDQFLRKFVKNRPPRPFGASLWRRWPDFGYCLFTDGTMARWRNDRQSREWPAKLERDGDTWLWNMDNGCCPICNEVRPDGKELYCSTRCRETAKKRRQRAR